MVHLCDEFHLDGLEGIRIWDDDVLQACLEEKSVGVLARDAKRRRTTSKWPPS